MIQFELPDGRHETWYDAADVSKALMLKNTNGKILGRNLFLQYCRYNGMIMKDSNQPKQIMITLGLMRFHMVKRRYKMWGMPLWSDRGIAYIQRRIENGEWQLGFEKRIIKQKQVVKLEEIC
jgi:hypothetical protein